MFSCTGDIDQSSINKNKPIFYSKQYLCYHIFYLIDPRDIVALIQRLTKLITCVMIKALSAAWGM